MRLKDLLIGNPMDLCLLLLVIFFIVTTAALFAVV